MPGSRFLSSISARSGKTLLTCGVEECCGRTPPALLLLSMRLLIIVRGSDSFCFMMPLWLALFLNHTWFPVTTGRIMSIACFEAKKMGCQYIGTEHVLCALTRV